MAKNKKSTTALAPVLEKLAKDIEMQFNSHNHNCSDGYNSGLYIVIEIEESGLTLRVQGIKRNNSKKITYKEILEFFTEEVRYNYTPGLNHINNYHFLEYDDSDPDGHTMKFSITVAPPWYVFDKTFNFNAILNDINIDKIKEGSIHVHYNSMQETFKDLLKNYNFIKHKTKSDCYFLDSGIIVEQAYLYSELFTIRKDKTAVKRYKLSNNTLKRAMIINVTSSISTFINDILGVRFNKGFVSELANLSMEPLLNAFSEYTKVLFFLYDPANHNIFNHLLVNLTNYSLAEYDQKMSELVEEVAELVNINYGSFNGCSNVSLLSEIKDKLR